jgi:hypothetical protein
MSDMEGYRNGCYVDHILVFSRSDLSQFLSILFAEIQVIIEHN